MQALHGLRGWLIVALLLTSLPPLGMLAPRKRSCQVPTCYCRDCGGGAQCCCALRESGLEKLVALSQCDRAEKTVLALRTMPSAVLTPSLTISDIPLLFTGLQIVAFTPLRRFFAPRDPPPRLPPNL